MMWTRTIYEVLIGVGKWKYMIDIIGQEVQPQPTTSNEYKIYESEYYSDFISYLSLSLDANENE